MELKEFIKGVLKDITEAVEESNNNKYHFAVYGTKQEGIIFDVEVIVTEQKEEGSKSGMAISVVNAIIGKTKSSQDVMANQNVQRLNFTIQAFKQNGGSEENY